MLLHKYKIQNTKYKIQTQSNPHRDINTDGTIPEYINWCNYIISIYLTKNSSARLIFLQKMIITILICSSSYLGRGQVGLCQKFEGQQYDTSPPLQLKRGLYRILRQLKASCTIACTSPSYHHHLQ